MSEDTNKEDIEKPPIVDGPFDLTIPEYGRKLKFDGLTHFNDWARKEHEAWQEIGNLGNVLKIGGNEAVTFHHHFFERLATDVTNWRDQKDADAGRTAMSNTIARVKSLLAGEVLPLSGKRGQRFLKLVDEDPVTAVGMLMWNWTRQKSVQEHGDPQHTHPTLVRAMTDARAQELQGKGELDAVRKQLEALAENWDGRAKGHTERVANIDAEILKVLQAATTATQEADKAAKVMRDRHDTEMVRIQKNFEQRMTLDAPAGYWRRKKWTHLVVAAVSFVAFGVAVFWGFDLAWNHRTEILKILPRANDGTIGLGAIGIVTIPALAYFWVLRLISRIFVTNLHAMADAGIRATMVTTFLALIEDETNPVSPDERLLVLQALFRPPTEAAEDGPTNLYDGLLKRATGKDS